MAWRFCNVNLPVHEQPLACRGHFTKRSLTMSLNHLFGLVGRSTRLSLQKRHPGPLRAKQSSQQLSKHATHTSASEMTSVHIEQRRCSETVAGFTNMLDSKPISDCKEQASGNCELRQLRNAQMHRLINSPDLWPKGVGVVVSRSMLERKLKTNKTNMCVQRFRV